MKQAVRRVVGASYNLSELVPTLAGWIVAKRVFLEHADELSGGDRLDGELFFEVMLEQIQQAMAQTVERVDVEMTDLIKKVYDADAAYDG